MKKNILGEIIGVVIIIFHFGILFQVMHYFRKDIFQSSEMRTLLGIAVPMFAIYVSTIIKHIIANQSNPDRGLKVRFTYIFICLVIPLLYCGFCLYAIYDYAANGNQKFEDLVTQFTIAQGVFGVFTGYIVTDLFGKIEPMNNRLIPDPTGTEEKETPAQ